MDTVGRREAVTQERVKQLFQKELGYRYLGHWKTRTGNSNVEKDMLTDWLQRRGHGAKIIEAELRSVQETNSDLRLLFHQMNR